MSEYIIKTFGIAQSIVDAIGGVDSAATYRAITDVFIERQHEEIVRCRDCEFGAYDGNECMRIDEWDGSLWFPVEPNGFCAWGERREK